MFLILIKVSILMFYLGEYIWLFKCLNFLFECDNYIKFLFFIFVDDIIILDGSNGGYRNYIMDSYYF